MGSKLPGSYFFFPLFFIWPKFEFSTSSTYTILAGDSLISLFSSHFLLSLLHFLFSLILSHLHPHSPFPLSFFLLSLSSYALFSVSVALFVFMCLCVCVCVCVCVSVSVLCLPVYLYVSFFSIPTICDAGRTGNVVEEFKWIGALA